MQRPAEGREGGQTPDYLGLPERLTEQPPRALCGKDQLSALCPQPQSLLQFFSSRREVGILPGKGHSIEQYRVPSVIPPASQEEKGVGVRREEAESWEAA